MTALFHWTAMACWAFCAAAFAVYAVHAMREIVYVTLPDGRKAERRLPLSFRLLLPLAPNFAGLAERAAFAATRRQAEVCIVQSGLEGVLSASEFIALKVLVPFAFLSAALLFGALVRGFAPEAMPTERVILLGLFAALAGWVHPLSWLRNARKRRHLAIFRALPFTLDLLTLSVEAGTDFMSALQRNCARAKVDPLNEELLRMLREIQLGASRRAALRQMAARVGQNDLTSVANALAQADELGVSIDAVLRIQSDQMRQRRFERAEKLANEAPVKMLAPLLFFIFPAVGIVLLAPLLVQAAKNLF